MLTQQQDCYRKIHHFQYIRQITSTFNATNFIARIKVFIVTKTQILGFVTIIAIVTVILLMYRRSGNFRVTFNSNTLTCHEIKSYEILDIMKKFRT